MGQRISRDLAPRGIVGRCGTRVAHGSPVSRLVLVIAASTTLLMGCILRDFDYEPPPNVPPAVLGSTTDPLDRIVVVNLDAPVAGDAGVGSDLQFVATVRDPDVGQTLTGLVFLDRNRGIQTPLYPEFPIVPEQDETPIDRRVPFTVPRARIATLGCHAIELHVSGGFVDFSNPRPAVDGDIGVGVWWIAAISDAQPTVEMNGCVSSDK